jgi:hypothetical protein
MEETYRLYLADEVSQESFGRLYRPLELRAIQLADEIPRLQAELDFARTQRFSASELADAGESLWARWPDLNPSEQRTVVETITGRIVVRGDEIEIHLCYLPPPEEVANWLQSTRTSCRSSRGFNRPGRRVGSAGVRS